MNDQETRGITLDELCPKVSKVKLHYYLGKSVVALCGKQLRGMTVNVSDLPTCEKCEAIAEFLRRSGMVR